MNAPDKVMVVSGIVIAVVSVVEVIIRTWLKSTLDRGPNTK